MQINQANLQALQQTIKLSSNTLKSDGLSVGQQILARVVAVNGQGNVTLHINNTILNAQSQLPLNQGQTLQLIVAQLGAEILLKPTPKAIEQAIINNAFRQSLPQEKPLKDVMQHLQQATRPTNQTSAPLPPAVTQAVRQFIAQLPSTKSLMSGQGLKRVMQEAGTFFENKLLAMAKGGSDKSITSDLKAMLMRLKEQVKNVTPGVERTSTNSSNTSASTPKIPNTTSVNAPTTPAQPNTTTPRTPNTLLPQPALTKGEASASSENAKTATQNTPTTQASRPSTQPGLVTSKAPPPNTSENPTRSSSTTSPETTTKQTIPQATGDRTAANVKTPPASIAAKSMAPPASAASKGPRTVMPNMASPLTTTPIETTKNTATPNPMPTSPVTGSGNREPSLNARPVEMIAPREISNANQSLLHNVQERIGELFRQIESALARTQLHQLNTLNDLENGKLAWSLEVPMRNEEDEIDVLKMRIFGDEEQKNEHGETPLTVTLEVDLQYIGPVFAKIILQRDAVSVGFWAEEATTVSMFQDHVAELQDRLVGAGLKADNIQCHHGPAPNTHTHIPQGAGLLDLKA